MAYSKDFRSKIVEAYNDGEGTFKELAERFKVGRDTVRRFVKKYRETGSLEKEPYGGGRPSILSKEQGYNKLLKLYKENPTLFNYEYQELLQERFGIELSSMAVSRAFKRLGISKKK